MGFYGGGSYGDIQYGGIRGKSPVAEPYYDKERFRYTPEIEDDEMLFLMGAAFIKAIRRDYP